MCFLLFQVCALWCMPISLRTPHEQTQQQRTRKVLKQKTKWHVRFQKTTFSSLFGVCVCWVSLIGRLNSAKTIFFLHCCRPLPPTLSGLPPITAHPEWILPIITAHCRPLLPITAHYRPLPPVTAHHRPLPPITAHYCQFSATSPITAHPRNSTFIGDYGR